MPEKFTFSLGDDDSVAASILEEDQDGSSSTAPNNRAACRGLSCFECGADPSLVLEPHVAMSTLGDNLVIIGAGAIGGFVGCCLYQGKTAVIRFLVRNAEQIEHYRKTGFTARSRMDQGFQASIPTDKVDNVFTTDPTCLREASCVFVATKRTSNASIHKMLCQQNVKCPVVFLQNGIRIQEDLVSPPKIGKQLVAQYYPMEAIVIMNVHLDKEAVVVTVGQHLKNTLLVLDGKAMQQSTGPPIADAICQLFQTCVINATAEKNRDIISLQAAKLQLNMTNAVNALCGLSIAETLQQHGFRQVLAHCIDECRAVFAAHKIPIHAVGPEMSNMKLKFMSTALKSWDIVFLPFMSHKLALLQGKTSMAQDLDNCVKKTEIEYLNGAVVQLGYEAGVCTPVNTRIVELVQRAEALQLGSPRLSPQDLLIEVGLEQQPSPSKGRIRAFDLPTLMSNDTVQEERIENAYSSTSSSSTWTNSTQYTNETNSSLRHRVGQMLGMTVMSSETTMMTYIQTPPMSPASTVNTGTHSLEQSQTPF